MKTIQGSQTLDFTVFEGSNSNYREMPKLIAAGLVPASAAQIIRGRLEDKLAFDTYYDSGDAIVYHPDGRVKLVWDSQDLRELNAESLIVAGALVFPAHSWKLIEVWKSIEGEEFSRDKITKYTGKEQLKDSVKGNPFWQWLSRDDKDLLGEYADEMFGRVKQRYGRDKAMGVCVDNLNIDVPALRLWPVLRPWCLGGISNYFGVYNLHLGDYISGHLVGVAPEAHQKLEETVRRT